MKIVFLKKFKPTRKQSSEFIEKTHEYILSNLTKHLSKHLTSDEIHLKPLGGGIKGVTYETFNIGDLVIKLCIDKTHYWNEMVGYHYLKELNIPTLEIIENIVNEREGIYGFITKKVKYPILGNEISKLNDQDTQQTLNSLGKYIKKIHNITVEGFTHFEFNSYKKCISVDPYYFTNYMLSEKNYQFLIACGLFPEKNFKKIYSVLKSYSYNGESKLIHGDLSLENCFYTPNSPILFDLQCSGEDPLYDLATLRFKLELAKKEFLWDYFLQGYDSDFDRDKFDILLGIIYFRKLVSAYKNSEQSKIDLFVRYLNRLV